MSWRENDFYRYYAQQPPVTRTLLLAVFLTSVSSLFYIISPIYLVNYWDYTLRGEFWRPVTAFLYAGSGMELLFGLFFAYQYSMQLEVGKFGVSTADYCWYLLFNAAIILLLNYFIKVPIYFSALTLALCTTSCLDTPDAQTNLFGMIRMPMKWLPYSMLFITFATGGPQAAMNQGTGLISAFLWRHVTETMPSQGLPNRVRTPAWLKWLIGEGNYLSNSSAGSQTAAMGGTARSFGQVFAPKKETKHDSSTNLTSPGSGNRSNIATLNNPSSARDSQRGTASQRARFAGQGHVLGGE
ncbi:hypothetical protein PYCC9005_004384 [Savitreella phatthalungensis]